MRGLLAARMFILAGWVHWDAASILTSSLATSINRKHTLNEGKCHLKLFQEKHMSVYKYGVGCCAVIRKLNSQEKIQGL